MFPSSDLEIRLQTQTTITAVPFRRHEAQREDENSKCDAGRPYSVFNNLFRCFYSARRLYCNWNVIFLGLENLSHLTLSILWYEDGAVHSEQKLMKKKMLFFPPCEVVWRVCASFFVCLTLLMPKWLITLLAKLCSVSTSTALSSMAPGCHGYPRSSYKEMKRWDFSGELRGERWPSCRAVNEKPAKNKLQASTQTETYSCNIETRLSCKLILIPVHWCLCSALCNNDL